ncbi:hypothetical protein DCMF_06615 [Candidatus Formimonas warabiya]|uniref:Uncharacterized protein n=2 Tax=Formimonas warabiya TaxID=1761012 RepID=A0A3G1L192_FORW1|nr:hypothetical protein DCMF_06615 [Candidatus Formimonas warabiya]
MDKLMLENWDSNMQFFFDNTNRNYYIKKLNELSQTKEIIMQADKICNHTFNLLGSGDTNLGEDIKWNQDFKSGFTWENKYYKKIKIIDLTNNADPKIPWELSRFQHIPILGQAYWITKDENYAKEFKKEIYDWINKNPMLMSINWIYAMDVAIRACNWIVGIYYFKNIKNKDSFWVELEKWLYMHGDFIFKNLERGQINNNHYLSDLVGLVWIGLYFKNLNYKKNRTDDWLKCAISQLEIEMEKQVYGDGYNYEASTAYHCLVTELLLYTSILCNYNGIFFSDKYIKKLEKMCEVIMNITKPNGLIPLIGDMDSGRFIMFTGYGRSEMRDFRYLLGVAGEYFDRDDFRCYSGNNLASLWMFQNIKKPKDKSYRLNSISYPFGGIYTLRKDNIYIIIRCGLLGIGNHAHNDQLSIELNIAGEDFIVDSGTYSYTGDYKMRNLFKSTISHNTLKVDNLEQNDFNEKKLFSIKNQTNAKTLIFDRNYFLGEHYGYKRKVGVIHKREIDIRKSNEISILDYIINGKDHSSYIYFHFAPGINITKGKGSVVLKSNKKEIKMYFDSFDDLEIISTKFSSAYGCIENNNSLVLTAKNKSILQTKIYITP